MRFDHPTSLRAMVHIAPIVMMKFENPKKVIIFVN